MEKKTLKVKTGLKSGGFAQNHTRGLSTAR